MTNAMRDMNTTGTGIGARLKAAREAMQLQEKDAAARLHLSVRFIDLMEKEDFRNGPPATFMRGYLRSYARLVKIPDNEINQAIEDLGMNTPPTPTISPMLSTPDIDRTERYVRYGTYLIAIILIGLVAMWWGSHTRDTENKASEASENPPPAAVNAAETVNTTVPAVKPLPTTTQPVTPPQGTIPGTQSPASPAATPAPGEMHPITNPSFSAMPTLPEIAAPIKPANKTNEV